MAVLQHGGAAAQRASAYGACSADAWFASMRSRQGTPTSDDEADEADEADGAEGGKEGRGERGCREAELHGARAVVTGADEQSEPPPPAAAVATCGARAAAGAQRWARNLPGASATTAAADADAAEVVAWYDEMAWHRERASSRMGR